MPFPENSVYIIIGEMTMVVSAMRRANRWSHMHEEEEQDSLLKNFHFLRDTINSTKNISDLEPVCFLSPFLDVIRSENTSGVVTALGLTAVHKFLMYGLIDDNSPNAAIAAENIADAVTHARFMMVDASSDEIVLMKIIQVLRLLLLIPLGTLLTNESVCEIIQSFFRMCFETRFSEILRRTAESALVDTVQLLFYRLPQFTEDFRTATVKKIKMHTNDIAKSLHSSSRDDTSVDNCKASESEDISDGVGKEISGEVGREISGEVGREISEEVEREISDEVGKEISDEVRREISDEVRRKISDELEEKKSDEVEEKKSDEVEEKKSDEVEEKILNEVKEKITGKAEEKVPNEAEENMFDKNTKPIVKYVDMIDTKANSEMSKSEKTNHSMSKEFDNFRQSDTLELNFQEESRNLQEITGCTTYCMANGFESSKDLLINSHISSKIPSSESLSHSMHKKHHVPNEDHIIICEGNGFVNPRGIRFTAQQATGNCGPQPYGLPCVRELFRLLISLINPRDRHNTDLTIQIGLSLITVALEAGADQLGSFSSLLFLVKDEMCRNLFTLLSYERLTVFTFVMRVFYLLFEALRLHLKFQLEMFLQMVMEIIVSESSKISYEQREIALECITQLWHIPGLVTELYINYDSALYCSNLFEDLTKLLSKNAFPLSGLYSIHVLSLEALLTVLENIESHCHSRMLGENKFNSEKHVINDLEKKPGITQNVQENCALQKAASCYIVGQRFANERKEKAGEYGKENKGKNLLSGNYRKKIPTHEELMTIKHKKKILASGTEQFNVQPSKGITFLQEHALLRKPLDPEEVACFLRNNPQLDKKMIGEYISARKNLKVLEAFVRSFSFENTRIDEALRLYLETFRLPGEAPLISLIMEHFAEQWHNSNNQPFANSDAAFTLAYAIIILNVDQHNHNVKKQSHPMTLEDFKKNLKDVNGGKDFDKELLEQIYSSIRNEEIVMPAEQTGLVRENYQWKVLLRRGNSCEGEFIHTEDGIFDHDLFSLVWGPTVAALSFIYDKSTDANIIQKTVGGFHKCALIAAHYGMSDVFDHLLISLCKFTSLVSSSESIKMLPISFGNNAKAQIATKAVFRLAHGHGDILREGWKNILDCILNLFKARLLPEDMVEAEDFVNPNGIISLIRDDGNAIPHVESSGLLSSFYSYITSESPQKAVNQEDESAKNRAVECIKQCHCEQLFAESKFLRIDSLQELVKTLIYVCPTPNSSAEGSKQNFSEESAVFITEMLIRIVLLNRDRVMSIWAGIQEHLFSLVVNSAAAEKYFLLERSVVGILRIAVRLVRKEEMIPQVMQGLQILLLLKMTHLMPVSRQVAYAMHELLRTNAANIHLKDHWSIVFAILERVGAGAKPHTLISKSSNLNTPVKKQCSNTEEIAMVALSDSELSVGHHNNDTGFAERGYISDSELYENTNIAHHNIEKKHRKDFNNSNENVLCDSCPGNDKEELPVANQYDISLHQEFLLHDFAAFLKCCESLAFLVRDAAHITAENFEACIHCIRIFLAASANGGSPAGKKIRHKAGKDKRERSKNSSKKKESKAKRSNSKHFKNEDYDADDDEEKHDLSPAYQHVSLQLLDLMHTLHTRASAIFGYESLEAVCDDVCEKCKILWNSCWCPLLQGIAELCCDARRPIRTSALTLLPRALLIPDLQLLAAPEWEACFNKVLFPLLSKLLENISPDDPIGMEETRMRGATLLCKVFLQHLTPLLSLPTFMALWLTILDFMDKYMHADGSGLLAEAIPESLKNMLLVMDTAGVFEKKGDKDPGNDHMWNITWDRINAFLPGLKDELFRSSSPSFTGSNISEGKKCAEFPHEVPFDSPVIETEKLVLSSENDIISTPSVSITMPDETLSVSPTVILHPPVSPSVYTIASTPPVIKCSNLSTIMSNSIVSPTAVPLLLNPSVMGDTNIQMFNTQL